MEYHLGSYFENLDFVQYRGGCAMSVDVKKNYNPSGDIEKTNVYRKGHTRIGINGAVPEYRIAVLGRTT